MHQPVLHIDTEEPSLVPQWLKDGVLKRNGCSTRGNRAGAQEAARRTASATSGWESQRLTADANISAADTTVDEQGKHTTARLTRSNSLRGGSSTKLGPGSSWTSKSRNLERFNSFERASSIQDRSSNSSAHDYRPASSDTLLTATSDTRSDRQPVKEFNPRSALLFSPSQTEEQPPKEVTEVPRKKDFPSLRVSPSLPGQPLSLESEFPALSPATNTLNKGSNWVSSLAEAPALSPVTAASNKGANWVSSLADPAATTAGSAASRPAAKNGPFSVHNGVRMAEAIQNAAANNEKVANNERVAREQLAMKHSKQLVPVIATSKHKGAVRHLSDPKLTAGLDGRKDPIASTRSLERLGSVERPDTKVTNGMLALKPQNSLKLSGRPSNRTTFFESLRRTNSVGTEHLDAAAPAAEKKVSRLVSESRRNGVDEQGVPVVDGVQLTTKGESAAPDTQQVVLSLPDVAGAKGTQEEDGPCAEACNGHQEHTVEEEVDAAKLTAEEEAFLRSLGWTDTSDEEDYALTEEEIAAFKATVGNKTLLPARPKVTFLPLSPHSSLDQYISDTESDSSSDYDMY